MTEITVGSVAFFDGMEGYKTQVTDKVAIVPQVTNGWWQHISTKDRVRLFHWQQHTLGELVQKLTQCTDCKRVTTLLVPDFAAAVSAASPAEYLAAIAPAIDKLCDKHQWGKTVYAAYVQNGSLTLTTEQREAAYADYKAADPDSRESKSKDPATK